MGSCAQIGKNVHLSGGVGIGGVLEPLQANPTIIEDNCFIGARSEVVEGVIVEEGSVISMGVYLGQSTKIYDRETGEVHYGRVPAGSVVVSGNLPSKDGKYSLYCAVIVKKSTPKRVEKWALTNYCALLIKRVKSGATAPLHYGECGNTVSGAIFAANAEASAVKRHNRQPMPNCYHRLRLTL